jgi:hypothetical protein
MTALKGRILTSVGKFPSLGRDAMLRRHPRCGVMGRRVEGRKDFFFEKKKQKTFVPGWRWALVWVITERLHPRIAQA